MLSVVQRENALAGGRWVKTITGSDGNVTLIPKVDSSAELIATKDLINGGNLQIQGVLTNFNTLLEQAVDKKIAKERYAMDFVLPVSYQYKERLGTYVDYPWWHPKSDRIEFSDFTTKYENFYFGKRASLIDSARELSMYRGSFRNLSSLQGVKYPELPYAKEQENPVKTAYDKTNFSLSSL